MKLLLITGISILNTITLTSNTNKIVPPFVCAKADYIPKNPHLGVVYNLLILKNSIESVLKMSVVE